MPTIERVSNGWTTQMTKRSSLAAATLAMLAATALGGAIRLEPVITADLAGPMPAFGVEIANTGDEPAREVRVTVALAGATGHADPIGELGPGQTVRQRIETVGSAVAPGIHNATVALAYTDIRGAPASAVSLCEATTPGAAVDDAIYADVAMAVTPLRRSATLVVTVTPLLDMPLDVTLRLVLPTEIRADRPMRPLHLDPDRPAVETFALSRAGARPGSTYAVHAVLDWQTNGLHRSVSASGTVPVKAGFPLSVLAWFALAAVLAVAFVVAQSKGGWRECVVPELRCRGLVCHSALQCPPQQSGAATLGRSGKHHPSEMGSPEDSREANAFHLPPTALPLLLLLCGFVLWHLSPADILRDTTTVGGDTPAHNYLASHLKEQWLGHGHLVSWANGWWGGFPMFQYYFPLPYALMALLATVLPFNIAFKLVCVAGAVLLPCAAFGMARLMRLPAPAPSILAILMVPFLFVDTHVMWGVNLGSTLAGMIANSLSFAIMLLALGSAWRDAADGRFRLRTVGWLALVMASHFFTSVMTALVLAGYPFLQVRGKQRRALAILAGEGALASALMAWWIVPLIATSAYSMEFGSNWEMTLWKNFPAYAAGLAVAALIAVGAAIQGRRVPDSGAAGQGHWTPVLALLWMLCAAVLLFEFGFAVSPVFVNVRLWPFLFFALMSLGGIGVAVLLRSVRARSLALASLCAVVLGAITWQEQLPGMAGGKVRAWACWNFSGLESKTDWPAFQRLVTPLKGTPGRLANDLSEDNNRLGSSRIFELMPHLIGKPVLEGGLVNSAAGALFAYYIQSETSASCAGYPPMMVPASFDLTNATRHLELFNVKHFVARWPVLQAALAQSPDWHLVDRAEGWALFELTTHSGRYVHVLEADPVALETSNWKRHALDWFCQPGALSRPVVLVPPGGQTPPGVPRITEADFTERIREAAPASKLPLTPVPWESVSDTRIEFVTAAVGRPHLVKMNWFPNWQVRGADAVYRVTPDFLLVYPDRERVDIYYGLTPADRIGLAVAWLGVGAVAAILWCRRKGATSL